MTSISCLTRICLSKYIQTVIHVKLVLLFYRLLRIDAVAEQWERSYKGHAISDVTKGKLERLLEIFMTIFAVLSCIIFERTEDSGNIRTNHSVLRIQR